MRTMWRVAALAVLALVVDEDAGFAQTMPEIRLGEPITAQVTTSDRKLSENRYMKLYRFRGTAGTALHVRAESDDVPLAVMLARDLDGFTEWLDVASVRSGGAAIRYTPPESGEYFVGVIADEADATGEFTLVVREQQTRPPTPRPIDKDTTINGVLTEDAAYDADEGFTYDYYVVTGSAAEEIDIAVSSEDFEVYLSIGRLVDAEFVEIDSDDDAYGGNSFLSFEFSEAGEYVIRVASLEAEPGEYTLRVGAPGSVPQPFDEARTLMMGEIAPNTTASDSLPGSSLAAHEWQFRATAGARIIVTLRSDAFDTHLELRRSPDEGATLIDDSRDYGNPGATRTSQVSYIPDRDEVVSIHVNTAGYRSGPYTLEVKQQQVPPESPRVQAITAGEVEGQLGEGDARLHDGSAYEHWTLTAQQGERLIITLRSTDFDAYLAVGRMINGQFEPVAVNDDAPGEGSDARVTMTVRTSGTYIVRVNTFGADDEGRYRLRVERQRFTR